MTIIDRLLGRAPCTCPVPMASYLTGDRCERHGEATECAPPKRYPGENVEWRENRP